MHHVLSHGCALLERPDEGKIFSGSVMRMDRAIQIIEE
jgi:hypothetical protein